MFGTKRIHEIAEQYYDEKTMAHAERVAEYAVCSKLVKLFDITSSVELQLIYDIAILHDILEDTEFKVPEYDLNDMYEVTLWRAVRALTINKAVESYDDYCARLKMMNAEHYKYAYIVKLADMKDHLSLKDTLTDRLKEKYLSGLAELL